MQMSDTSIFVFVEGRQDRYVYSRLVEAECRGRGIAHKIVCADEIESTSGGKQAVLGFFSYLRKRSSLIDDFKGKTTLAIFSGLSPIIL